jgi:hypothetical protein
LSKINLLPAGVALVFFVKFIGKNFLGFAALRAFAAKRLQMFKLLKAGAVLGSCHKNLLISIQG